MNGFSAYTWFGMMVPAAVPIEVRYVKFSSRVPAFRWTDSTGKQVTRTGYTAGGLQALIDEVLNGNVAQSRVSE